MHRVTLGIHSIKKQRTNRVTRFASRAPEFEELKLHLFDPLHQPLHKNRYPEAWNGDRSTNG